MTLGSTPLRRTVSFLTYMFFLFAGLVAVVYPPETMTSTAARMFVYGWSALVIVGGAAGLHSAVTENVLTELVGLYALIGAMLVFDIAIAVRIGSGQATTGSLIVGFILLGLTGRMTVRMLDLRALVRDVRKRP